MGTQYEIYAVLALEVGGFAGGPDAAGQGHFLDAALAPEAVELAEVAADAVDGVLAHVAGVEDDEFGLLIGVDLGVAGVQDHAPHTVRVVDVHLAAEGADAGRPGLPHRCGRVPCAGFTRDLYRGGAPRRFDGVTHNLPPARIRGLSRRSLPGGSRARDPRARGNSPSQPALVYPRYRPFPPRPERAPAHPRSPPASPAPPPAYARHPGLRRQPASHPPARPSAPCAARRQDPARAPPPGARKRSQ